MSIKIYGNTISGSEVGISVAQNANVEIGANQIANCATGIEIRDEQSLRTVLGLSNDISVHEIKKLLVELNVENQKDDLEKAARSSGVERFLTAGSNITTLVDGFWKLKESGLIQSVLSRLGM